MPVYTKSSGTWKAVKNIFVKNNSQWRDVQKGYVKNEGVWKNFYNKNVGKFIYVGSTQNLIYFSDDGTNWTSRSLPVSDTWRSLAYNSVNNILVLISSTKSIYSADKGITWSNGGVFYSGANLVDVVYGNGIFSAVGGSTAQLGRGAYSNNNAASWIQTTLPTSSTTSHYSSITYGNNRFVASSPGRGATRTNTAVYSNDGISWATTSLPFTLWYIQALFANNRYLAAGYSVNPTAYGICYSSDGISWSASSGPNTSTFSYPQSIAYGNGKWVVLGDAMKAVYSTDNGATFNMIPGNVTTNLFSGGIRSFTYGQGKFLLLVTNVSTAGYSNFDQILTSEDGFTWTHTPANFKTTSGKLYYFAEL